jgi:hypothetical protein
LIDLPWGRSDGGKREAASRGKAGGGWKWKCWTWRFPDAMSGSPVGRWPLGRLPARGGLVGPGGRRTYARALATEQEQREAMTAIFL